MPEEQDENYYSKLEDKIMTAARVAHSAKKALSEAYLDFSVKTWESSDELVWKTTIGEVTYLVERKLRSEEIGANVLHNYRQDMTTNGPKTEFNDLPDQERTKIINYYANIISIVCT